MLRRRFLTGTAAAVAAAASPTLRVARATEMPGVTAAEIRIGNTVPYSGPASNFGVIGRAEAAFFRMVNEEGGVAGRKITFISLDDGYTPPKTVEQTRRLVEEDEVAFLFSGFGTPTNSAVARYLNEQRIPDLFLISGADKWGDVRQYPWTIGWLPSYRTEAQIYAKYIFARNPNARIGILWQNDDGGKDYVAGVRDVAGERFGELVRSASYEVTDPTIDSQVVSLQSAAVDALILIAVPKFSAMAIRKVFDIGWKPQMFLASPAASVGATIGPAGPEKAVGIVTAQYLKDSSDPAWSDDPGMREWRAFMRQYLPDADLADGSYVVAYAAASALLHVLKQCGSDLSRANIMRQAENLHDLEIPVLLPGIKVNTSPTNRRPVRRMQLARWSGTTWTRFGDVIEGHGT
jgi:ABC-type branched-subunit amino acid transport system substrate-binding protein